MKGTFQFLGTGASAGVPVIGCECSVCTSVSSKNKRFRPSGLIRVAGKAIAIDMGPDFRSQALAFGLKTLDGLLLTHTHYDHIAGIDEVRIFNVREKKSIPCLLSQESYDEIQRRYYYFFNKDLSAKLDFFPLDQEIGETEFLGIRIGYCNFYQSGMKITGFRIGDFAYVSDIRDYDESVFLAFSGVKNLVLSALRPEPSLFHLSFAEAIEISQRLGAQKTWLTHVGHFFDHDDMNALLPPEVQVAYDGLKLEFSCTN
jgi:phosphoribosyl 1,2-cyclic phosphate phosphodiesterase